MDAIHAVVVAVVIQAGDLDASLEFYRDVLGFRASDPAKPYVLQNGELVVELVPREAGASAAAAAAGSPGASAAAGLVAHTHVNFLTADLDGTVADWRARGVTDPGEVLQIAVGRAVRFRDPSGNLHHLLEIPRIPVEPGAIGIFNVSMHVDDLDAALSLYGYGLGLEISTLAYLPETLPMKRSGGAPIVIHAKGAKPGAFDAVRIRFGVADPRAAANGLAERGAEVNRDGERVVFRDGAGLSHELVRR